jgi:hypothetical protein
MGTLLHQPQYTTAESVKVRLAGKVQFQRDTSTIEDGELPDALLHQLIADAETAVEQELRGRYAIPFRSKTRGTYQELPDHSKRALRMAVDMKAVMLILKTDFGRGSHIKAEDYFKELKEEFEAHVELLLGRDKEGKEKERYRYSPPLEDLALAGSNHMADDGTKGMIINTDQETRDAVTYAEEQVNDPSSGYLRGRRGGFIQ